MLEITKEMNNQQCMICLKGRLDTNTAKQLEDQLDPLLKEVTEIQINCQDLEYISSAGLRVILAYYKKSTASKIDFILSNMNSLVKEVFDISGFAKFLKII